MLFDLASLTKPLVTAPLALEHLDLDRDWRLDLGFRDWPGPVTPRRLLSHSAGLPPWLPYTGMPLSEQMAGFGAWGSHPLLKKAKWGESAYSDLGYRLLAEMLETEMKQDWRVLGENLTGLACAPWGEHPVDMPPGADMDAWPLATGAPFPAPKEGMPHDANARAGMKGHAGFGATPESARRWLWAWTKKFPSPMAVETGHSGDGEIWGLGLQRLKNGAGGFAELLDAKVAEGVHVVSYAGFGGPPQIGPHVPTDPSDWWFHLGYTGPALFVRPGDGACVLLLCHRLTDAPGLLPVGALMARRRQMLNGFNDSAT
jgi:CubicO group peptidase (beta-lactamase class C family)